MRSHRDWAFGCAGRAAPRGTLSRLHFCLESMNSHERAPVTSDKRDYRMQLFDPRGGALSRSPTPTASANQPSLPAYATALTNWPPSNPISKPFLSIHTFALGARVSIPAAANACSSRVASARSISMSNPWIAPGRSRTSGHDNARRLDRVGVALGAPSFNGTALFCDVRFWG